MQFNESSFFYSIRSAATTFAWQAVKISTHYNLRRGPGLCQKSSNWNRCRLLGGGNYSVQSQSGSWNELEVNRLISKIVSIMRKGLMVVGVCWRAPVHLPSLSCRLQLHRLKFFLPYCDITHINDSCSWEKNNETTHYCSVPVASDMTHENRKQMFEAK